MNIKNLLVKTLTNILSGLALWFVMIASLVFMSHFPTFDLYFFSFILNDNNSLFLFRLSLMTLPVIVTIVVLWKLLKVSLTYYLFGAILSVIAWALIFFPPQHILTYITCIGKNKGIRTVGYMGTAPVCVTSGFADAGKPCSRPKDCLSGICKVPSEMETLNYVETGRVIKRREELYELPEWSRLGVCYSDNFYDYNRCRVDDVHILDENGLYNYYCLMPM